MVLQHGEDVFVAGDDPETDRLGKEDGLLATRKLQHVERILALLRRHRVEGDGRHRGIASTMRLKPA